MYRQKSPEDDVKITFLISKISRHKSKKTHGLSVTYLLTCIIVLLSPYRRELSEA